MNRTVCHTITSNCVYISGYGKKRRKRKKKMEKEKEREKREVLAKQRDVRCDQPDYKNKSRRVKTVAESSFASYRSGAGVTCRKLKCKIPVKQRPSVFRSSPSLFTKENDKGKTEKKRERENESEKPSLPRFQTVSNGLNGLFVSPTFEKIKNHRVSRIYRKREELRDERNR